VTADRPRLAAAPADIRGEVWGTRRAGVPACGRGGVPAYRRTGVPAYRRLGVSAHRRAGVRAYRRAGVPAGRRPARTPGRPGRGTARVPLGHVLPGQTTAADTPPARRQGVLRASDASPRGWLGVRLAIVLRRGSGSAGDFELGKVAGHLRSSLLRGVEGVRGRTGWATPPIIGRPIIDEKGRDRPTMTDAEAGSGCSALLSPIQLQRITLNVN
jgi:hypothetical protein